jgi:hypothetical protein
MFDSWSDGWAALLHRKEMVPGNEDRSGRRPLMVGEEGEAGVLLPRRFAQQA